MSHSIREEGLVHPPRLLDRRPTKDETGAREGRYDPLRRAVILLREAPAVPLDVPPWRLLPVEGDTAAEPACRRVLEGEVDPIPHPVVPEQAIVVDESDRRVRVLLHGLYAPSTHILYSTLGAGVKVIELAGARNAGSNPDARLARKSGGHEARLAYCGNILIENRHGLVVDTELLQCNGTAERDAAMLMAERLEGTERVTLAGDKGYDTKDFVKEMRGMNVTPHVAQNQHARRTSANGRYTARDPGGRFCSRA